MATSSYPMTEAERQARFRSRLRALASEPERLLSGNYRDACPYCGQVSITASAFDLDGARCACPPRCQVCGGAAVVGDLTVSPNTEKRPGADGLKAAS